MRLSIFLSGISIRILTQKKVWFTGVNQVVVDDTLVYFDGSASSDNVGIASYVWTFIDGEAPVSYTHLTLPTTPYV